MYSGIGDGRQSRSDPKDLLPSTSNVSPVNDLNFAGMWRALKEDLTLSKKLLVFGRLAI